MIPRRAPRSRASARASAHPPASVDLPAATAPLRRRSGAPDLADTSARQRRQPPQEPRTCTSRRVQQAAARQTSLALPACRRRNLRREDTSTSHHLRRQRRFSLRKRRRSTQFHRCCSTCEQPTQVPRGSGTRKLPPTRSRRHQRRTPGRADPNSPPILQLDQQQTSCDIASIRNSWEARCLSCIVRESGTDGDRNRSASPGCSQPQGGS